MAICARHRLFRLMMSREFESRTPRHCFSAGPGSLKLRACSLPKSCPSCARCTAAVAIGRSVDRAAQLDHPTLKQLDVERADGLGLQEPRIFVEVKHRNQTTMGAERSERSWVEGSRGTVASRSAPVPLPRRRATRPSVPPSQPRCWTCKICASCWSRTTRSWTRKLVPSKRLTGRWRRTRLRHRRVLGRDLGLPSFTPMKPCCVSHSRRIRAAIVDIERSSWSAARRSATFRSVDTRKFSTSSFLMGVIVTQFIVHYIHAQARRRLPPRLHHGTDR